MSDEVLQLPPAIRFRSRGQVSPYGRLLMEQAELHGNTRQQLFNQFYHALTAIDGDARELPALGDQVTQSPLNALNRLRSDLLPENIVTLGPVDHQAIAAAKERRIKCQGHRVIGNDWATR